LSAVGAVPPYILASGIPKGIGAPPENFLPMPLACSSY